MLDIKTVRTDPERVKQAVKNRNGNLDAQVDELLEIDAKRREIIAAVEALKAEQINKVCLIAFTKNDIGNAFWNKIGWTKREDLNYYDFTLNEANITAFIEED